MISVGFKKQMIDNAYKTQLLPVTKDNTVNNNSIETNKCIINLLLFRINDKSSLIKYKYKYENIDDDIHWFLTYLISPFYYSIYYKYDIQKNISSNIKNTIEQKQNIDNSPDYAEYAEYLEDIYD